MKRFTIVLMAASLLSTPVWAQSTSDGSGQQQHHKHHHKKSGQNGGSNGSDSGPSGQSNR